SPQLTLAQAFQNLRCCAPDELLMYLRELACNHHRTLRSQKLDDLLERFQNSMRRLIKDDCVLDVPQRFQSSASLAGFGGQESAKFKSIRGQSTRSQGRNQGRGTWYRHHDDALLDG